MNADFAYLANITEQSWIAQRTYGTFQVPGCPSSSTGLQPVDEERAENRGATNGVAYALTEITARKGTIDLGDKRTLDFPISAREIAEDIAREINSDAGDGSYFGVFVCAGDAPTDAELAAARARLAEYYRRLVAQADQDWERSHNWLMITDVERRAARWLGLEKEWSYEPKPLVDCPACAEKLKPGVAVCKSCGAVLDPEKAARFGLAPPGSAVSMAPGLSSAGFQPAGVRTAAASETHRQGTGATAGGFVAPRPVGAGSRGADEEQDHRQDAGATSPHAAVAAPPAATPARPREGKRP
jgi:hypothetical protein